MRPTRSEITLIASVGLILLLGFLGWRTSPEDAGGRPLLLLPDIRRVEAYRTQAGRWAGDMRLLDGQLTTLLANGGDLLSQSRAAQAAFEDSLSIVQETDRRAAPPALTGLRSTAVEAALVYLEASRSVLLWISAPKPEYYDQAVKLLQDGRLKLSELESSVWIK